MYKFFTLLTAVATSSVDINCFYKSDYFSGVAMGTRITDLPALEKATLENKVNTETRVAAVNTCTLAGVLVGQ